MINSAITYHQPKGLEGVELLSCLHSDFAMGPHVHDAWVLWVNAYGGEKVRISRQCAVLLPDSFGIVAPGEVHENSAIGGPRSLLSLYFEHSFMERMALHFGTSFSGLRSRLYRDPEARQMLLRLHEILRNDGLFAGQEALVSTFGLLFARHGNGLGSQGTDCAGKLIRAREFLRQHLESSVTLDDLADWCACSPYYLVRLFKKRMGMTPHAYLMELRLDRARRLIRAGEPLCDVALHAGFTDQSHMTRRFRARFGLTPGAYLRQLRG